MKGLRIVSFGSLLPSKYVTNDDLAKMVDTSDEWIYERTGIHGRYFCDPDKEENTNSLALGAARQALERSGIAKEEIGALVVATITARYATPSCACILQSELGLSESIPVLDINAACSGFLYALEVARGLLETSGARYALVIGAEQLSRLLNMEDRSTCVLFGDGAGAAVVERADSPYFPFLGARGGTEITCNHIGFSPNFIRMDGQEVFRFAVKAIPFCINHLLEMSHLRMDDLDFCVCHQANSRIIDHVVKKGHYDPSRFFKNMEALGNTSAASIPLALAQMYDKGMLRSGMKLMLVGFGSGLTWGGVILTIA